jgi:ABC-2 type transport system permease protein
VTAAGADATASADDELAGLPTLLGAVLYKRALLLARYPVNTLAQFVTVYMFFALIFYGGQAAASQVGGGAGALADTFDGLIVGWFLWTMTLQAYFRLAITVTSESQWGTLEQLYMSPYGFGTVMAASVVAHVLESFVWGAVILPLMLVTTGRTLAVDLLTVVPVTLLTLLSVVGIGFVFAGGALLYKRIQNVTQLMQFVILGLIAGPIAGFWPLRLLPIVQGSAMLQRAMRDGVRLWEFSTTDLGVLTAVGVTYALAGYLVFRWCAKIARKRGVMGHY